MLDLEDLNKVEDLLQKRTRHFIDDFRSFLFKQNIIALAIGVMIGTAVNAMVTALVADLVMPLVNLILKNQAWRTWSKTISYFINEKQEVVENKLLLGDLIWNTINLLIVGLVAYIFVRILLRPLAPPPGPPTTQCPFCLEQVPMGAKRCKFCTSDLSPPQLTTTDGTAV